MCFTLGRCGLGDANHGEERLAVFVLAAEPEDVWILRI